MAFTLRYTIEALAQRQVLKEDVSLSKRYKAVKKAIGYLQINPRHPSLNTHEFTSLSKKLGKKVFEAYAENNAPVAYRVFWYYGPQDKEITILSLTPHP